MPEVKIIHQTLHKMFPAQFRSPATLAKIIRIVDPKKLIGKKNTKGIEISAKIWIHLPSKPGKKASPRTLTATIQVSDLTPESVIDLPLAELIKTPEGLVQGLFLSSLLALGIFTDPLKREAFKTLNKLD